MRTCTERRPGSGRAVGALIALLWLAAAAAGAVGDPGLIPPEDRKSVV